MKIKNLFKSLMVVALIVPFVVGLAACGKKDSVDYESVDAADVYETFRTALVSYNQEQTTSPNQFTVNSNVKFSMVEFGSSDAKSIVGVDLENELFYTYTVTTVTATAPSENGETVEVSFVKDVENAKRVYTYSKAADAETATQTYVDYSTTKSGEEKSAWETYWETATENFSMQIDDSSTGYVDVTDIDTETDMATFKTKLVAAMNESVGSITEDAITFTGKKYKDGRIGFVVTVSQTMPYEEMSETESPEETEELMTVTIEYVVKDNQIVGINIDSRVSATLPDENQQLVDVEVLAITVYAKLERSYNESYISEFTNSLEGYQTAQD